MIFSIYVNHRHPSPPPRRHLGGEEAAHLPTLFVPSEQTKTLGSRPGVSRSRPARRQKRGKPCKHWLFCFSAARSIPSDNKETPPCALSGRRGRKAASTACRDAKICKFDFLKIHLLKFIYVNLIFLIFCWQKSQKSRFFFAFPVKWAIAEEVTFSPPFRPFRRENEGRRTRRRLLAAHVQGRKCPPPESP